MNDKGNIELRRMELKDIERVVALEADIFSDAWSGESFVTALEDEKQIFMVIEETGGQTDTGEIIAYGGVMCVLDEGQILNIAVNPSYRHRGFGERITRALIDTASVEKDVSVFTLEVRAGNEAAIRLYHKLGFTETGRRTGYYCRPLEDAVLMDFCVG